MNEKAKKSLKEEDIKASKTKRPVGLSPISNGENTVSDVLRGVAVILAICTAIIGIVISYRMESWVIFFTIVLVAAFQTLPYFAFAEIIDSLTQIRDGFEIKYAEHISQDEWSAENERKKRNNLMKIYYVKGKEWSDVAFAVGDRCKLAKVPTDGLLDGVINIHRNTEEVIADLKEYYSTETWNYFDEIETEEISLSKLQNDSGVTMYLIGEYK